MRSSALLAAVLLSLAAAPLGAQAADSLLRPGTRVRLVAPAVAERPLRGRVNRATRDTLYLGGPERITLAIPRSAVIELRVSAGGRGRGAAVGAGAGALTLGVSTALFARGTEGTPERRAAAVVSFAAGGAAVGALLGSALGERWEAVAPRAAPGGGGLALGLTLPAGRRRVPGEQGTCSTRSGCPSPRTVHPCAGTSPPCDRTSPHPPPLRRR